MGELTRELDRLVDGELTLLQQRKLLETIDSIPGGWRQCALAFLQSQAWEQALSGAKTESYSPPPTGGPTKRLRSMTRRSWWVAVAGVAAVLVGMVIGDQAARRRIESVSPVAGVRHDIRQSAGDPLGDSSAWRLVVDSPGGKTVLPVYSPGAAQMPSAGETATDRWWKELASELKEVGQPLDERQRWYSVSLDDGRQVLIPVDELQLPASAPAETVSRRSALGESIPQLRQLESWLQGTTAGRLRVIRIGPAMLFADDSQPLRQLEWERAEARLERLERQLEDLQSVLREALAQRHRSK